MARYFFDLCDGNQSLIDAEGRDLDDPSLIGPIALREARAMISQDALGGRIVLDQYIEVRDGSGNRVHRLSFRDAISID